MQRVIWVHPDHPKCIANATTCPRTGGCAAHEVQYTQGRALADYSNAYMWHWSQCAGYLSMDGATPPVAPARKAHPPIGFVAHAPTVLHSTDDRHPATLGVGGLPAPEGV